MNITQYESNTKLVIRNSRGGMIWQIYTIQNDLERKLLEETARANGFGSFELVPGWRAEQESYYDEDTFPGWRESAVWKERYSTALAAL